jgi:Protein of unknown function (DUF4058)
MPLRDHFRPPVSARHPWDTFHFMYPAEIVRHLFGKLPPGYAAGPGAHHGGFEVDIAATQEDASFPAVDAGGGTATVTKPVLTPATTLTAELSDQDEYEVQIYDDRYDRRLVAAVEIVSPGNKDRPEARTAFAAKCAALLRRGVCVSVVDLVTTMHFNLYADTLAAVASADPSLGATTPHTYTVTVRPRIPKRGKAAVNVWFTPLAVGQPLPSIPLWLAENTVVMLDLDPPYEEACRVLHIR